MAICGLRRRSWLAACGLPSGARRSLKTLRKSQPRRSICSSGQVGLDPARVYQVRGRVARSVGGPHHFGRRHHRLHPGRDGPDHGSVFRGRRRSAADASERSRTKIDEPVYRNGNSGRTLLPPPIFASTMMRRPSCGPICGQRTTSRSLCNAGERRRKNLASADATRLLMYFQPDASGERQRNFFRASRSRLRARTPQIGFCTRGCRERSWEFSTSTSIPPRRNRFRPDRRKRPRMAIFITTSGLHSRPAMRGLPRRSRGRRRLKMRERVRAGSRFAATRSRPRCSLRNEFMREPACNLT